MSSKYSVVGLGKLGACISACIAHKGFEVVGLEKAKITIEGSGPKSSFMIDGIAEARGDTFKNPVTGEEHLANIDLPTGFIWTKGECGQGTFRAASGEVSVGAENSNWILYSFDWSNS